MTSMMKMTKPVVVPPTSLKTKLKRFFIGLLSLIALLLISYFLIIRPIQVRRNHSDFVKAEASLETLSQKIIAQVGQPDQIVRSNECGYASREFGRGARGCGVGISLKYPSSTPQFADESFLKARTVVGTTLYNTFGQTRTNFDKEFIGFKDLDGADSFEQDYKHVGGLSCGVSYKYGPSQMHTSVKNRVSGFEINLSCGGSAMAEFFPVTK